MRGGYRRLAKILLGIAVSLGLLAYLFATVDVREVARHLGQPHWGYLVLSAALAVVGVWVRARRWRYLFPPQAIPSRLFSAVMIGYMANNVLPLRAGELVRVYLAARRGPPRFWTVVATVVVERMLDALAVVVILAGLVFVIPVPAELKWAAFVFLGVDLAAMAVLAALAMAPERFRVALAFLTGRWPPLRARALGILDTFALGLDGIRAPAHLLPLLCWSAALWVVYAITVWTALAAAYLPPSMTKAWTVIAFVGVGISLPSAPAFVGVVQAAGVLALALFGVPRAEALSFSFLYHASQFVPITLWGWILLVAEQVSLFQLTREAVPRAEAPRV